MAKNSIGQFIAALRKANGMTQQDVADRLNVSNKAVSRWERDECAPDLSLIPALAEMFGVTCDELLKGERIPESTSAEKKEPRVEKQVRNLVNRTLSGFKTLIWISLAVAVVGLICMFGISYGFYRPVIGFAVMLLFEACALVIAILAVSRTKDVKNENELFEAADSTLTARFNETLGSLSFMAFFVILAAILLSLPLILVTSSYVNGFGYVNVNSVITPYSYFTVFFGGIVLILTLVYLKCKKPYMSWITGSPLPQKANRPFAKERRTMTMVQIGLTLLAGIIFVLAPYLQKEPLVVSWLYSACLTGGLVCLAASIICFFVFLIKHQIKHKTVSKELVLPGIRNIFLIPSAILSAQMHNLGWSGSASAPISGYPEHHPLIRTYTRYSSWEMEYFWYAAAWTAIVFVVFSLLEAWITRKTT